MNWEFINIFSEVFHFNINSLKPFTQNNRNVCLIVWQLHLHGRVVLVERMRALEHVSTGHTCAGTSDTGLTGVLLVQEVVLWHEITSVLLLVWVDASLRRVDMALTFLSNWISRLLNIKSILLNLTLLILVFPSVVNCDVFVGVLFVYFSQMLLSKVKDLISDVTNVSFFRSLFNLGTDDRVLFEDFLQQELLLQLHGFDILFGCVNEFTFLVEANIVITNVGILVKLNWRICWVLTRCLDHAVVSDCYSSLLNEIHVRDFIFFI